MTSQYKQPFCRRRWTCPAGQVCPGCSWSSAASFGDGLGQDPQEFGYSWLLAFSFFLSCALGSLFLTMIHHLTSGWSVATAASGEHLATFLFPWPGPDFLPLDHFGALRRKALIRGCMWPSRPTICSRPNRRCSRLPDFCVASAASSGFGGRCVETAFLVAQAGCNRRVGLHHKMRFHSGWGIRGFAPRYGSPCSG